MMNIFLTKRQMFKLNNDNGLAPIIIILSIVLIIALLSGYYYYYNFMRKTVTIPQTPITPVVQTTSPSPIATAESQLTPDLAEAVVTITNKSFLPSTIVIKVGQSIRWVNNDTLPHQIASDPYPREDKYPELDSDVKLAKKDSFSTSFSTAGVYTYHDHLNPMKLTGTIIVKD